MNRYEKAWRHIFNNLPRWKREALKEDLAAKKDSLVVGDFTKAVIELAEGKAQIPEVQYVEEYEKDLEKTQ